MVLSLTAELEAALCDLARRRGTSPEELALGALRAAFLSTSSCVLRPRDEWERRLLAVAKDCGVSLSDEAVSSEGLYD